MVGLRLEQLGKTWPDGTEAVRALNLEVEEGTLAVLVGPSGCGKSTILRMIAGLEPQDEGRIFIDGREVSGRSPGDRDVAMVFQDYALYPHKTVEQNLEFPLKMRKTDKAESRRRIAQIAEMLGIEQLLRRRPAQLSGGQRQRVALGRALVREPSVFLLDEPLSNLDVALRIRTRAEILRLHRRVGATMVYVTHDQEEAMTLADKMAVLRAGRVEQFGPPEAIYARPETTFVAQFVGSPPINWFEAEVGEGLRVGNEDWSIALGEDWHLPPPGTPVLLGIRPRDLIPTSEDGADLAGYIELTENLGHEVLLHLQSMPPVRVIVPARQEPPTRRIGVRIPPSRVHLFDVRSGRRLSQDAPSVAFDGSPG